MHTQNDEETPFIMQWQSGLRGAGDRIGRTFDVAPYLKRWMEEAGFVGVREMVTKVFFPPLLNQFLFNKDLAYRPSRSAPTVPGPKTPAGKKSASTSNKTCSMHVHPTAKRISRASWAGRRRSSWC